MNVYFGGFSSREDLINMFFGYDYLNDKKEVPEDFPAEEDIIYAAYGLEEAYTGDATVLYERKGNLYIVQVGHCSCFDLEGQWDPAETSWSTLFEMEESRYCNPYDVEAVSCWNGLVRSKGAV